MWIKNCNLFRRLGLTCRPQMSSLKFSDSTERPQTESSTFTKEEEIVILDVINKCDVSDFQRFDIKATHLKKLLSQREKCGQFKSFDSILMTQDVTSLIKFCKSILTGGKTPKTVKSTGGSKNVTPTITDADRCEIKNVLGLHVWGDSVSWAFLETSGNVSLWDFQKLDNISKISVPALVDLVTDFTLQLPFADAFVMESDIYTSLGKLKPSAYQIHLQRQQIIAMILSGIRMKRLITNEDPDPPNNVFLMQARYPAKLFNLKIGTETVSGAGIISKIIHDKKLAELPDLPALVLAPEVIYKYNSHDVACREKLHSVLLLTLAFYNEIYIPRNINIQQKIS